MRLLSAAVVELPMGDATPAVGEAFGQSEPLTRRLKHILELYPEVRGRESLGF